MIKVAMFEWWWKERKIYSHNRERKRESVCGLRLLIRLLLKREWHSKHHVRWIIRARIYWRASSWTMHLSRDIDVSFALRSKVKVANLRASASFHCSYANFMGLVCENRDTDILNIRHVSVGFAISKEWTFLTFRYEDYPTISRY